MKKTILILVSIIILLSIIFYIKSFDGGNIVYIVDDQKIILDKKKGFIDSVKNDPPSVIKYFGNEAKTDLDDDGRVDSVFLITINSGGTGTFFYVLANLNKGNHIEGSKGYFIGDRISPQTTEVGEGNTIIINYADRGDDEPFSAEPSIGKSLRLKFNKKDRSFEKI
jgi:hypothetical protein